MHITFPILLTILLAGVGSGLLAGLFGVGGGIILVPTLFFLLPQLNLNFPAEYLMQICVATSLATMCIVTFNASMLHAKKRAVDWKVVKQLAPWLLVGVMVGSKLASKLASPHIRKLFIIILLIVAAKFLLTKKSIFKLQSFNNLFGLALTGIIIGLVSGMFGIGGGVFLVPLLIAFGFSANKAAATSVTCAFPTVLVGAGSYILIGSAANLGFSYSIGLVIWPLALLLGFGSLFGAPIGVYLAHNLPSKILEKLFGLLLIIVSIKLW